MPDESSQSADPAEYDKSWEQRNPEIVREITIEEYKPVGTLVISLIYLVIIVVMWIFMYFIEFGGNAPSIID
jgi:hypothetical protein